MLTFRRVSAVSLCNDDVPNTHCTTVPPKIASSVMDETVFLGTRLCVVGSICRDVKTGPLRSGDHLLKDGETPVPFIAETIGGGGANTALFAAGLGAEACFAGKVGADALGLRLENALRSRNVIPWLRRDPKVRTGSSLVLSFDNGSRHFISSQPNNSSLSFQDLDMAMLEGAEHLLRADVWFSQPMLDQGNADLLMAARQRGISTSMDLNWDPLWGHADLDRIQERKRAVRKLLPLVNLVHGNARELNLFADSDDLNNTLRQITVWGGEAVVIHLGAQGAGYYCRGELTVEPCSPVNRFVNTAGTGDLLSACLMLLHARNELPVRERLRLANHIVAEFIEGRRHFLPTLD